MQSAPLVQPYGPDGVLAQLGTTLSAELASGCHSLFRCCVAFATGSGSSRVFGPLRDFVRGGGEARMYVGVRNNITSAQAVGHLLACGAAVYGCDTGGSVLFHPKVYVAQGEHSAWIAVGSANLTREGLYRNFEVTSIATLELPTDEALLTPFSEWLDSLHYTPRCIRFDLGGLPAAVEAGLLVDEAETDLVRSDEPSASGRRGRPPFALAPVPPPHPEALPPVRRRRQRDRGVAARTAGTTAHQYFAMTLSAFDSSHRRDKPGTPEISIPEEASGFFPPVAQDRKYPDAYFQVVLNTRTGTLPVEYRVWHRPPGTREGHADWRINVRHHTIDLTTREGGDIVLFERLVEPGGPSYEAWIVAPDHPTYDTLLARCTIQVEAVGQAGTKRYGFF